jgi:hypothetical protein
MAANRVDRKQRAAGKTNAIDPQQTSTALTRKVALA